MPLHHYVHVSGGKDSTALLLRALEHREKRGHFSFKAVFADTDHEHPTTYEYVDFLSELSVSRGGPPIRKVKADLTDRFPKHRRWIREQWPKQGVPAEVIERALAVNHPSGNVFVDSCILNAGFPSPRARFCTDQLKIRPTHQQVFEPIWKRGGRIIAWQGIRADESIKRATLSRIQTLRASGPRVSYPRPLKAYRPLLDWTIRDVWLMHRKHGVRPNDLYRQGMKRVGCFPCIMTAKAELRVIAERFPEAIDKLEEWERIVGLATKRAKSIATFFQVRSRISKIKSDEIDPAVHGIRSAAEWSKTTWGGKQYDMLPIAGPKVELVEAVGTACGEWGVCE